MKCHCNGSFQKEDVLKLTHSFIHEFSIAFKPILNTGTLKTSAYHWFLGYFFCVYVLNTDTIKWLVRTGTSVKIPAFMAQLFNLCLESRYASKSEGVFTGEIPADAAKDLYDIFYNLEQDDIKIICSGTFLSSWSENADVEHIRAILDLVISSQRTEDGISNNSSGVDYIQLFEYICALFLNIRNNQFELVKVQFSTYKTSNLSFYRFRDSDEKGRFIASSKGLDSISEATFTIEVIFLRLMGAVFSYCNDSRNFESPSKAILPGEMSILVGSIPLNNIFESLFSIHLGISNNSSKYWDNGNSFDNSSVRQSNGNKRTKSTMKGNSLNNNGKNHSNDLPNNIISSSYTTLADGRNNILFSRNISSCNGVFYFKVPLTFIFDEKGILVSGNTT